MFADREETNISSTLKQCDQYMQIQPNVWLQITRDPGPQNQSKVSIFTIWDLYNTLPIDVFCYDRTIFLNLESEDAKKKKKILRKSSLKLFKLSS